MIPPHSVLAKIVGGSRLYGTDTPESDYDYRSIILNTDPAYILGTKRFDQQAIQKEWAELDTVTWELRHFLCLLQKSNTMSIELMWAPESAFTELTDDFKRIRCVKDKLLDTKKFVHSIAGYLYNERRYACGARSGKQGGQRRETVEKFGYSPKNVVNFCRIAYCAKEYLKFGHYPVVIKGTSCYDDVMDVKVNPQKYTMTPIENLLNKYENMFVEEKLKCKSFARFDEDLANDLLGSLYFSHLEERYGR